MIIFHIITFYENETTDFNKLTKHSIYASPVHIGGDLLSDGGKLISAGDGGDLLGNAGDLLGDGGHHNVILTLCKGSEALTEWKTRRKKVTEHNG